MTDLKINDIKSDFLKEKIKYNGMDSVPPSTQDKAPCATSAKTSKMLSTRPTMSSYKMT